MFGSLRRIHRVSSTPANLFDNRMRGEEIRKKSFAQRGLTGEMAHMVASRAINDRWAGAPQNSSDESVVLRKPKSCGTKRADASGRLVGRNDQLFREGTVQVVRNPPECYKP